MVPHLVSSRDVLGYCFLHEELNLVYNSCPMKIEATNRSVLEQEKTHLFKDRLDVLFNQSVK